MITQHERPSTIQPGAFPAACGTMVGFAAARVTVLLTDLDRDDPGGNICGSNVCHARSHARS